MNDQLREWRELKEIDNAAELLETQRLTGLGEKQ